jgi:CDP-glucose 4,6-dehydratase
MNELEINIRRTYQSNCEINSHSTKVLVTGHTGFKGTWLLGILQELGCEVIGYALDPHPVQGFYQASGFYPSIDIRADIRDRDALQTVVQKHRPDLVFHLAAQSLIYESIKNPSDTYETNIMGLVHLLESLRTLPHTGVVVVTSDKCYQPSDVQHVESSRLGGNDPYSVSKAAIEMIVHAYRQDSTFDHSIATARSGNVIGSGDFAEHRLIPDWIRSQVSNTDFYIRRPKAFRPFQHVLEPLMGYLILGHHLLKREKVGSWNFGPQKSLQVQQVIDLLEKQHNRSERERVYQEQSDFVKQEHFLEQEHLHIDSTKAKEQLGWYNRLTPHQMIEWTLEGYMCGDNARMEDICRRQIQRYWNLYFSL